MGDFLPIIYINYNLYYYGGFRAPNCLMTFVTYDTRDLSPPEKKRKKLGSYSKTAMVMLYLRNVKREEDARRARDRLSRF